MKYYAVKQGRSVGIFTAWDECKKSVQGYSGAIYKKFDTREAAEKFLSDNINVSVNSDYVYIKSIDELNDDEAIAYVDGSYRNDNSFSYGYILLFKGERYEGSKRFSDPELIDFRNVSGEVMGAVEVIKKAIELKVTKLYLHHDYTGIRHWALKEWKANNKLTIEYQKFCSEVLDKINIEFIKIKSHTGVELNEYVDKLANDAEF